MPPHPWLSWAHCKAPGCTNSRETCGASGRSTSTAAGGCCSGSRTVTPSTSTSSTRTEGHPMAKDDTVHDYPNGIAHLLPPVHPGSVLADELQARGLTSNSLALALRVPANRISDIVRGQRAITAETA